MRLAIFSPISLPSPSFLDLLHLEGRWWKKEKNFERLLAFSFFGFYFFFSHPAHCCCSTVFFCWNGRKKIIHRNEYEREMMIIHYTLQLPTVSPTSCARNEKKKGSKWGIRRRRERERGTRVRGSEKGLMSLYAKLKWKFLWFLYDAHSISKAFRSLLALLIVLFVDFFMSFLGVSFIVIIITFSVFLLSFFSGGIF